MKITFSDKVTYIPTWRGNDKLPKDERFSCDLTVLEIGPLMELMEVFQRSGLTGEVDTDKVESQSVEPLLKQFSSLLPKHVVRFEGLYDQGGRAITVEEIVRYPFYTNLGFELLMKLVEISSPSDDDVKN
jgi:hypothetical protein